MGLVLGRTFEGKQMWIKARDGTKIDSMFFPVKEEFLDSKDYK